MSCLILLRQSEKAHPITKEKNYVYWQNCFIIIIINNVITCESEIGISVWIDRDMYKNLKHHFINIDDNWLVLVCVKKMWPSKNWKSFIITPFLSPLLWSFQLKYLWIKTTTKSQKVHLMNLDYNLYWGANVLLSVALRQRPLYLTWVTLILTLILMLLYSFFFVNYKK